MLISVRIMAARTLGSENYVSYSPQRTFFLPKFCQQGAMMKLRKTYLSHIVRNSSFCICVYFWFESVFGLGRVLWPQMDNQTSPINLYMSPLWQSITLTSLFYTLYRATTEFLLYFTNQNDENARRQLSISRKLDQSILRTEL